MRPVEGSGQFNGFGGVAAGLRNDGLVQVDVAHPGQAELHEGSAGADEAADEVVGGFGEDPFRGVVLDDLGAGSQDGDPVTQLDGLAEVVGDEDDGLVQLFLQPQQLVL